jgi:transmembrane sensor
MDELAQELDSLREEVVPAWSEARSERLYAAVGQLRRRRRTQKVAAGTLLVLGACALGYVHLVPAAGRSFAGVRIQGSGAEVVAPRLDAPLIDAKAVVASVPRLRAHQQMQLADGSRVHVVSSDGELSVERNERDQIGLRLAAGVARFEVVPNTRRRFIVAAGSVEVGVVGTVFEVERAEGRVRVSVSEGKVRVRAGAGTAFVQAGQSTWFDEPGVPAPSASSASDSSSVPTNSVGSIGSINKLRSARSRRGSVREETPRAAWRSLGQSGDYEGAYRLLAQGTAVEDDSEALMDAADAARLSGHSEAAVAYLRKVLSDHRAAPVAPLAAFTLGRVLLERLGQPSEAADAFAMARTIAPQGSLAQDALAREVEALSKAGHPHEAYQRAHQYVESYPEGRRLRAVQLYGGLRTP